MLPAAKWGGNGIMGRAMLGEDALDFGFPIADFGLVFNPQSEIRNPESLQR
jgi:hypothetical protein